MSAVSGGYDVIDAFPALIFQKIKKKKRVQETREGENLLDTRQARGVEESGYVCQYERTVH